MQISTQNLIEIQKKKLQSKRLEYLEQMEKVEKARKISEKEEREKAEKIMKRLDFKEQHAQNSRMLKCKMINENNKKIQKRKFEEVKDALRILQNEEVTQRKLLKKKQEEEVLRSKEIKLYKEYIKTVRAETSMKFKFVTRNVDYENPYFTAELREQELEKNATKNKSVYKPKEDMSDTVYS